MAGISCDGKGKIYAAPPICRYMIGKHINWALFYCKQKRWATQILPIEAQR